MTRTIKRLLVLLFISGLIAFAVWYSNRPKPIEVITQAVEKGIVEKTAANTRAGTVKACRRAKLSPGTGGQISQLNIKEGDTVKTGMLLLELWNKDIQAQINLSEAEANAATASARAICLQAEVAQREANRKVKLRRSGAVSEDAIDKAVTDAKARTADCESANATARVSQARLVVTRSLLEKTQLYAPFDGVVAEINGELNEYVTPSPPGIATPPAVDLIDNSCFYMVAPIDEVDAPKIEVNQEARVNLDAFDDQRFPGTVRRIATYVLDVEKQARTVEVEVAFSNPEDLSKLLPGYSADVEIILDVKSDTLRIPTEAILENERIFVLDKASGTLEERTIETGMSNWDHTEVLSGVKEGEQVVTTVDRDGVEDGALAQAEKDSQ